MNPAKKENNEENEELDCLVTVNDGSHMTCDMIEKEPSEEEPVSEEYDI
jgi:hypothetical protein